MKESDLSSATRLPEQRSIAVIFDFDGVIIDSDDAWLRAHTEEFGNVGLVLTPEQCVETAGLPLREAVSYWYERQPWVGSTVADIETRILARVVQELAASGSLLPGVREVLDVLRSHRIPLGVASSASYVVLQPVFERFAIRDYFEVVCSTDDEEYGKPDPAVYLSAAKKLSISPSHCIAIEDTPRGIKSAKRAGCRVVAVSERTSTDRSDFDADWTLPSLTFADRNFWEHVLDTIRRQ